MTATATKPRSKSNVEPLLEIRGLKKYFPVKKGILNRVVGSVKAVDGLSFDVYPNETVGLVGESGCGKTTAGRSILRLLEPSEGQILFRGSDIVEADTKEMRRLRRNLQIIFQDPYSSLNPRMTVEDIIGEAIKFHGIASGNDEIRRQVQDLLERVGLQPSYVTRYPHEFSGGQRQRIGIARALALNPDFIVCDEAVSALDVSVQAQVINLLLDLQDEFNLSYLFIAHDLSVVRHISDRIAVMYLGQIMELAECETLFSNALHPYTQSLLSAIPQPNPRRKIDRVILKGDVPSPMNPPTGCRFHTRCPACYEPCDTVQPRSVEVAPGHEVACHLYDQEYAPTDPSIWNRLPRLPRPNGDAKLPPGVAEVIEEITPGASLDRDGDSDGVQREDQDAGDAQAHASSDVSDFEDEEIFTQESSQPSEEHEEDDITDDSNDAEEDGVEKVDDGDKSTSSETPESGEQESDADDESEDDKLVASEEESDAKS